MPRQLSHLPRLLSTSREAREAQPGRCLQENSTYITTMYYMGRTEEAGVDCRLCCFRTSSLNIFFSSFLAERASLCTTHMYACSLHQHLGFAILHCASSLSCSKAIEALLTCEACTAGRWGYAYSGFASGMRSQRSDLSTVLHFSQDW